MPDADGATGPGTEQWVAAGIALGAAILVVTALRVLLRRRTRTLASAVLRGELTPEADTRIRLAERFAEALVLAFGLAAALSHFDAVRDVGRTLLASGAIAAAVIGFAARQTLANLVAGIMLAITQPIRVGDWVSVEEQYGVVEDVRLNYTVLRTPSDQRIVIPNERLASGVLRNDTLGSPSVGLDVQVWLPPGADAARAVEVLRAETRQDVTVAEALPWGIRLAVGSDPCPPPERAAREAALRLQCVRRLQAEGLMGEPEEVSGKGFGS